MPARKTIQERMDALEKTMAVVQAELGIVKYISVAILLASIAKLVV